MTISADNLICFVIGYLKKSYIFALSINTLY